jgi:hypothetical protein
MEQPKAKVTFGDGSTALRFALNDGYFEQLRHLFAQKY